MRTMKSIGGLTHGRGISNSVLTMWMLGMVYLHNVCDEIEKFCGISIETTEQHVDIRSARIVRDNEDLKKLINWFSQHSPFPKVDELMSISTGVIGDKTINCHKSQEIGMLGISKIIGNDFDSVKFKRKDKVIPLLAANSSIKIDEVAIPIHYCYSKECVSLRNQRKNCKNILNLNLPHFLYHYFPKKECVRALNLLSTKLSCLSQVTWISVAASML